ncbi:hypothetical protein F4804DRAFT_330110 [Jackrogersella minutella]|nr:hypothetical protein F4804DRAFT_330110 [Jackrogersella minutella]
MKSTQSLKEQIPSTNEGPPYTKGTPSPPTVATEVDQQHHLESGPPSVTQFRSLPTELRLVIWEDAMPEPHVGYVALSNSRHIFQTPPALAHVCRESREIALKSSEDLKLGKMYELEDGRKTWFCKETDYFLWSKSKLGLGELAPAIQNIVIPLCMLDTYEKACESFETLLTDAEFIGLQNIFVDLGDRLMLFRGDGQTRVKAELFQSSSIIVPDLSFYDNRMDRIDAMASKLPSDFADHWKDYKDISSNEDIEHWWVVLAGDVTYAFVSTMARLCEDISDEQYDDFEAETLMHPSGISWWDFFMAQVPTVMPTRVIARITDREKLEEK